MAAALIAADIVIVCAALYFFRRKNKNMRIPNSLALVAFMFLIASTGFILWQQNILSERLNHLSWPKTTASIIESKVIGDRAFRPDIIYEYEINDHTYKGQTNLNTPGFGNRRSRRDTAERIISEYRENKKITVYYNPHNPAESYIRPGPQWSDYVKYAVSHLLFIFTLFVFVEKIFQKISLLKKI